MAGRYYHVSSSDGLGVVVNTNGDNQAALAVAGDEVSLIPFWTLAELLPPGGLGVTTDAGLPYLIDLLGIQVLGHQAGGLNTSTQWVDGVWQYGTWCPNNNLVSVLFPDHSSPGTDLPLQSQAYPACEAFALNDDGTPAEYLDSVGMSVTSNFVPHWFDDAGNNLDSRIIPPDGFVVLRSGGWAGAADGHLTLCGYNEPGPWVTPLSTRTSGCQDTYLAFPLVRPVLFSQLQWEGGLIPSPDMWDGAGDMLFTYWPGTSGFMRCADGVFFPTLADGWVDYVGWESMETYVIPAHTVFFIRKNPSPNGASSFLKYQPAN